MLPNLVCLAFVIINCTGTIFQVIHQNISVVVSQYQLIQHLSSGFSALQSTGVRGLCLVPSVLVSLKTSDDLEGCTRMIYLCQPLGRQSYIVGNFLGKNRQDICPILLLKLSMLVILSTILMYTHTPVPFLLLLQHVSIVSVLSGG